MYVIYISQRGNLEKAAELLPLQSNKKQKLKDLLAAYKKEKAYTCKPLI